MRSFTVCSNTKHHSTRRSTQWHLDKPRRYLRHPDRARHGSETKEKPPIHTDRGLSNYSRRRSTLPPALAGSTIDAEGLNCRVRNGNGCFPLAIATGNLARSVKKNCGSYASLSQGAVSPLSATCVGRGESRRIFRSLTTSYWELTLCFRVMSFQKSLHRKSIFPPRDSVFPWPDRNTEAWQDEPALLACGKGPASLALAGTGRSRRKK